VRELKKQDRTSSRLPTDTERKYKLGQIELTAEELEKLKSELVIDEHLSTSSSNAIANKTVTNALNNKVTKEEGKTLSSNDFTDNDKKSIHVHANKSVLDSITQEKIDIWNGGANVVVSMLDVYPIGSIYMSVNETDPSTLFGGTWERIKGRFLLGAGDNGDGWNYTANTTGGEPTHTLTQSELPDSVWHTYSDYLGSGGIRDAVNPGGTYGFKAGGDNCGKPHNNLPPYLAVYIWKRIS
jgi:hypothetical protein